MKIQKVLFILIMGFSLVALSGCGTLFAKRQTITVKSDVDGAMVYSDTKYVGTTPCTFKTRRAKGTLTLSKKGYENQSIHTVVETRYWLSFLDIIPGCCLGYLVDSPSGVLKKYGVTNYFVSLKDPDKNAIWNLKHEYQGTETSRETERILFRIFDQEEAYLKKQKTQAKPKVTEQPKPVEEPVAQPKEVEQLLSTTSLSRISIAPKANNARPNLEPKAIYKKYKDAVFVIYTSDNQSVAQGSGFFVSSSGIAISNYHVFKGTYKGNEIIKLPNGNIYQVEEVLAQSEKYDYIVFKVNGSGFPYLPVSNKGCEIGDKVVAIGSPLGLENTLSEGLVSQLRPNYVIQISVPIDHGSSGGALINSKGEVIGITSGGIDASGANLNYAQDIRAVLRTEDKR